jgi:N-acetylglucosamine-6-phosphate deacetylase
MPPIHHRDPGVIGLLGHPSSSQRPFYGLIVDNLHCHSNTVRIAYGACKEGCILVTDGMSDFTSPPTPSSLPSSFFQQRHMTQVVVRNIVDMSGYIGSILTTRLAQSIMDPGLEDGVHDWRPGVKFRKDGYRVVIDGTNTLAGRYVVSLPSSFLSLQTSLYYTRS